MRTTKSCRLWQCWGLNLALLLAVVITLLALDTSALAQNGTWTNLGGGGWASAVNWNGGTIASGTGSTADFSTLTLTADTDVILDTPATIGKLVFADQGNAFNWILLDGYVGPLTLDAGTNQPVITVVNTNTTITAILAGTNGLVKTGAGTLTLSGASTYTGATLVNAGTLTAQ